LCPTPPLRKTNGMIRTARTLALLAFLAPIASLVACTPRVVIPDEERERIADEFDGRARYLRVAAYAAPFFGDTTRFLLTDQPVEEIQLLEGAGGDKIPPPPSERVLLPGTRVRIRTVEFPTPWVIAKRIVMTPRYHAWAVLELEKDNRPYVIVLPQEVVRLEDVKTELDRLLSADDPTPELQALPRDQQEAIRKKDLVEGMTGRAVEMAWGQPEKRRIDRPAGTDDWTWPGGRRSAHFKDDRLVRWERR
jgi:hypothetical protein